uniref:MAM domain-containing protein, meprin/A5/mu n=1 Tax=Candidatus Kentrum sp. SD TaxID=2126332 RepID=A0A450Z4X5_9GAMM|nr:MAG: MAM domain-containing protein, meprin/A5/mu [Candidatus Kentron sp. SD]
MKHFGSGYAGLGPHHGDARDARVTGKQRKSFSRFHAPARGRVGASIFSIPLAALLGLATLPAHALEHTTGFEVDIRGWTVIKGTSQFNWARQTRGTHSGHTGPSGAHEGDYYLYLEASRNYPSRTAYLQSREFSGKIQTVSFHYHMYGAHMGSLALEGLDGNSWFTL